MKASLKKPPSSFLYRQLSYIGIENFAVFHIRIPDFLRQPPELSLIRWFHMKLNNGGKNPKKLRACLVKPPLNLSFPGIKDVTRFKDFHSDLLQTKSCSLISKRAPRKLQPPPSLLTIYKNLTSGEQAPSLLTLLSSNRLDVSTPTPFQVDHNDQDISDFSLMSLLFEDVQAIAQDDQANILFLSVQALWNSLKQKTVTSFLLCSISISRTSHSHMLSFTLPRIVSGSALPASLLKYLHPYWIFKAIATCEELKVF